MCKANARINSSGYISFGATPPTSYGNNVGAWLGYDSGAKLSLYATSGANYLQWNGSVLTIKAANFCLDANGCITAANANITGTVCAGAGCIGGFFITTADGIYSGTGATRVQMKAGSGFWAGADAQASAPFYVTAAGAICSTSGTIGGWTIETGRLCSGSAVLCSSGVACFGAGASSVIISAADATYRLWAGHETAGSAPFRVSRAGAITSTSGTIGGWCITSNCICSVNTKIASDGSMQGNFFSGLSGWCIGAGGNVEFANAVVRGELRSAIFKYDEISAVGGQLLVANAGTLLSNFTTPALAASVVICLKETTETTLTPVQRFFVNDVIRVKTFNGTNIYDFWGIVTVATNRGSYFDYAVTACSGSVGVVIPVGSTVVSYGPISTGGGILLNGQGTNSPYIDIFSNTATPWAVAGLTAQVRLGKLDGVPGGYSGYGLWTNNGYIVGGVVCSNNWGVGAGSCFNLTTGCLTLGGSSAPKLTFNGSTGDLTVIGTVCASAGCIATWTIDGAKIKQVSADNSFISIGDYPNASGYTGTIHVGPNLIGTSCGHISIGNCLRLSGGWISTQTGISVMSKGEYQIFRATYDRITGDNFCGILAGWNFTHNCLYSGNLKMIASGSIQGKFTSGSAGWFIGNDGSAEFNNVTVRGTVCASSGCFNGTLSAGIVNTTNLTVLATNLLNPVTATGNVRGWGAIREDGTGTSPYISYDATECALKITYNGNYGVMSQSWMIDHNKIYRISMKIKKSAANGQFYVGASQFTTATLGTESGGNQEGVITFIPYSTTRVASDAYANMYFTSGSGSTSYECFIVYLIGANRSVNDAPIHCGGQIPFAHLNATAKHVSIRLLNWANTVSTSMFIKDISAVEVGQGMIVSENITATGQIVGKDFRTATDAGNGTVSGIRLYPSALEGWNGATKTFCLNASDGDLFLAGCMVSKGVFYRENTSTRFITANSENTFIGDNAGNTSFTGDNNIGIGVHSLLSLTTGCYNIGIGVKAGCSITTGCYNHFIGYQSGYKLTTGNDNIAIGALFTMSCLTTGSRNIALGNYIGDNAAYTGTDSIIIGRASHRSATTASCNIIVGNCSYQGAATGTHNVVVGHESMVGATSGIENIGIGNFSMRYLTTGAYNVSIGMCAGRCITTGCENTFVGYLAGSGQDSCSVTGCSNTAVGFYSLTYLVNGSGNTAVGKYSSYATRWACDNVSVGEASLLLNMYGSSNTAVGKYAMCCNCTGNNNTSIGMYSLRSIKSGCNNTAVGYCSLASLTSGNDIVAVGYSALGSNTSGAGNVAYGTNALCANTTGNENVAIGSNSLVGNISGCLNIAIGRGALCANTANANIAIGAASMAQNKTGVHNFSAGFASMFNLCCGHSNVAIGQSSMYYNCCGSCNVAIGHGAMCNNCCGSDNIAIGTNAGSVMNTGCQNISIGCNAGNGVTTACNVISIGCLGANVSNTIFMGNTSITCACINVGWTYPSDIRRKKDITEIENGLDVIRWLKPVCFRMKSSETNKINFGFIAQEVECLFNSESYEIVGRGSDDMYGLRYTEFIAPAISAIKSIDKMSSCNSKTIRLQRECINSMSSCIANMEIRMLRLESILGIKE
jgi:hypothetical protein